MEQHAYKLSDAVVVIGQGVGRITGMDDSTERMTIMLREGEVVIRRSDARDLLRAVVTREEAARFFARLCERVTNETRDLPTARSLRELSRAPFERQVEYARWHFRKRGPASSERDILNVMGEHVIAEIAIAIGAAEDAVRAAVKRGKVFAMDP